MTVGGHRGNAALWMHCGGRRHAALWRRLHCPTRVRFFGQFLPLRLSKGPKGCKNIPAFIVGKKGPMGLGL